MIFIFCGYEIIIVSYIFTLAFKQTGKYKENVISINVLESADSDMSLYFLTNENYWTLLEQGALSIREITRNKLFSK